jgi:hypothetical protein
VNKLVAFSTLLAALGTGLFAFAAPASASGIPYGRTPVASLAPAGFHHQQVLRIDQDFHPNDDYEIALDAWTKKSEPGSIAEVRMWWLDTATSDERSPFGKGVRRHIDIDYTEDDEGDWTVRIQQGRKIFQFEVELLDSGKIAAYADVESEGATYEHCRVQSSRLVARKILGIPAGLKALRVTCTDDDGNRHKGNVKER